MSRKVTKKLAEYTLKDLFHQGVSKGKKAWGKGKNLVRKGAKLAAKNPKKAVGLGGATGYVYGNRRRSNMR